MSSARSLCWILLSVLPLGCAPVELARADSEPGAGSSAETEGRDTGKPDSPEAHARALQREALEAHGRGDVETFTRLTSEALALHDDPTLRYNLACGQARLGQRDAALATLREILALRIDFGAALDPDFESLREDGEFVALMGEFAALFPAVHTSRTELVIDAVDLLPEGIAHHDGRTFVSSMTRAGIYEVDETGETALFAELRVGEVPLCGLGLAVDGERRRLWAVGTAFDMAVGYAQEHAGTAGLFAYDLDTKALVESRIWPGKHPGAWGFNDLALAKDGTVYASGGGLHVAAPGQAPVFLKTSEPIAFANGLALTPDEVGLYAAAGPEGIAYVRLADGHVTWIERPADQYIRGFDGLYLTKGRLVGVQHGQGGRWRALQLDLDATGMAVEVAHVLEQKHPDLLMATTAYVDGESMVMLAGRAVPEGRQGEVPESAGDFATQPVLERVPLIPATRR